MGRMRVRPGIMRYSAVELLLIVANQNDIPMLKTIIRSSPTTASLNISNLKFHSISLWRIHQMRYIKVLNFVNLIPLLLQSNPVRIFQTDQSRVVIEMLNPCLSYWVRLTAVECAAVVSNSPWSIALFQSATLDLVISVNSGDNNIVISWRSSNQYLWESVKITVTSECPAGIVTPQTQVFTVTPDEGNSVNVRGLGIVTD